MRKGFKLFDNFVILFIIMIIVNDFVGKGFGVNYLFLGFVGGLGGGYGGLGGCVVS